MTLLCVSIVYRVLLEHGGPGILVLLIALGAMSSRFAGPSGWNVVFGIWLIISPWVLGFADQPTATTNSVSTS